MRSDRTRIAAAFMVLLLLPSFVPSRAAAADAGPRIAVLMAQRGTPFDEIRSGFRRRLQESGIDPAYSSYYLDEAGGRQAFAEGVRAGFDLVLALGGEAAETASRQAPAVPVVAGGILRPDAIGKGGNATGVFLEFPPEVQMRWIRSALPGARVVGVLYNPEENRDRIEAASRAARDAGLRLEARAVSSPHEIPAALDSLYRRSDVIWALYDRLATTPETAPRLLLDSFRHRVPVVGLSASWVKAGAFAAPDWDHEDVGAQCAEMAVRILKGEKAAGIAPAPARRIGYALNLNTARKIGIRIPKSAIRDARSLFPGKD